MPVGRAGNGTGRAALVQPQRGKGEVALRLKLEQETAGGEILEATATIPPVPVLTQFAGEPFTAPVGMSFQGGSQPEKVLGLDRASLQMVDGLHGPRSCPNGRR